ncbi:hypothetical protein [Geminocystis sp. GBBB08]|uniref:hypothetical protein n=1 Tax=Geminocystis sp. GBBB08 TaxID=2604140 RepID=UPI0027E25D4A|nr:hypothetical protein [Geminocystis sp. GBBB08]MBL1208532.1 hypothetical protein [Geminocystis sp. GBBB08]
MKVWLVSFLLLFLVAQFLLWLKNFVTPLPLYIFGGAFLAIVSNYDHKISEFITEQTNNILSSGKKLNE